MADVQITVRGTSDSKHPPELATVHLGVAVEGPTRDGVFAAVSATASTLAGQIGPLYDPGTGPVTQWASEQVRTWSHRPWNDSGRQLPHVHHAGVDFRVTFADFDALSRWIAGVLALNGVSVSHIAWSLTEPRAAELTERSRSAAVLDAVGKARSYARSLGLGEVRPVAIADSGMLADGHQEPIGAMRAAALSQPDGQAVLDFTPQDIVISAAVDARFVAG